RLDVRERAPGGGALLETVVRQAGQAGAVQLDQEQIAVGLRLARQRYLLGRVASPLAGEDEPLAGGRKVRVVVPATPADQLAQAGAILTDEPDVEVALAVAGERDPLAGWRPVTHGVGPLPLGKATDVRAVAGHEIEVLRAVAAGAEDELLAVGGIRGKAVVAGVGREGLVTAAVGADGGDVHLAFRPLEDGTEGEGDAVAVMRPRDAKECPRFAVVQRAAARAVEVHHVETGKAAAGQGEALAIWGKGWKGPREAQQPQVGVRRGGPQLDVGDDEVGRRLVVDDVAAVG